MIEVCDGDGSSFARDELGWRKKGAGLRGIVTEERGIVVAWACNDEIDKTVGVKRYVLPKFKTEVTADKRFYLPKETIRGEVQVRE